MKILFMDQLEQVLGGLFFDVYFSMGQFITLVIDAETGEDLGVLMASANSIFADTDIDRYMHRLNALAKQHDGISLRNLNVPTSAVSNQNFLL